MSLEAEQIFPTPVWIKELNQDSSDIMPFVESLTATAESVTHSNYGGFQSHAFCASELPEVFNNFRLEVDKLVTQIHIETGLPELTLDNLWVNVNPPGTYNMIHNHPGAIISGVYYIDVPEDNMGNIRFYRDDDAGYYIPDESVGNTTFTGLSVEYKAQTGILLLFPSWLKHSVQGNMGTQNRVSMSFNYGVNKNAD